MTEQRTAQILDQLNTYTGDNLWQDVILGAPWYDEAATDAIDENYSSDRFATTDGAVIVYAAERQEWVEDE